MRILGIDPGLGRLGWGIVEEKGSTVKAVAFDCIETPPKTPDPKRLLQIHKELLRLIRQYQPSIVAVEELFFSRNVTTAFMVGQARGVVLLASAEADLPVVTHSPNQVKLAVTGYGKADKKQIAQMVKVILCLQQLPRLDDTTDALAIALTEVFSRKMGDKLRK
ncbi:MAG TPA: crossover junction endodeoxyribonuclease RuvC [Patescibacteria group bacterium]|nr:crossover junction endodeoxyribonuclease RuvC [Patescibacteria group bacterium]